MFVHDRYIEKKYYRSLHKSNRSKNNYFLEFLSVCLYVYIYTINNLATHNNRKIEAKTIILELLFVGLPVCMFFFLHYGISAERNWKRFSQF